MYQEQLVNRDEMVQGLLQERDGLKSRNSQATKKVTKLQKQLDTYQVALGSKDLKLFQLVEERDYLKQRVQVLYKKDQESNNHSAHSRTSTATAATTTTTTSSYDEDDDNDESTEQSPINTTSVTTTSPSRWVQGLNRIRPARRSPKVQPSGLEGMKR